MRQTDLDAESYAQAFVTAWNTPDAEARRSRLAALVASDLIYADPHVGAPVIGRNAYADFADRFRSHLPDLAFVAKGVSVTSDDILLRCDLQRPDGTTFSEVCFVFLRNCEGEASRIIGFMEKP
jgi:hypothetical protein